MKVSELIKLDEQLQADLEDRDCCELCATHNAAERQLEKILYCPHCNQPDEHTKSQEWGSLLEVDKFSPVGDWYADPDEEIRMWPILKCPNCGKEYALVPMRVIHNYGHDVYYTGKRHVLPNFSEREFVAKLEPVVQQYLDRCEKEKDLTAWNLSTWISRELEKHIWEIIENNYKEVKQCE